MSRESRLNLPPGTVVVLDGVEHKVVSSTGKSVLLQTPKGVSVEWARARLTEALLPETEVHRVPKEDFTVVLESQPRLLRRVKLGEYLFPLDTVLELLETLSESDGFINRVVIYNDRLAEALEKLEAATANARGSYGPGPKLAEVKAKIEALGETWE